MAYGKLEKFPQYINQYKEFVEGGSLATSLLSPLPLMAVGVSAQDLHFMVKFFSQDRKLFWNVDASRQLQHTYQVVLCNGVDMQYSCQV